jgi:hypothetical protein
MMQSIYRVLLRLHPRRFRERFEAEMLRETPTVHLIADALFSLARQWTLRPRFLEESAAPASVGGPQFFVFRETRPPTGALLEGGILSIVLFTLIGLGISHGEMPEIHSGFTGLRNLGHPLVAGLQYAVSAPARWSRARNLPQIPMPVSTYVLQTYVGVYVTSEGLHVFITLERGGLRLDLEGEPAVNLIPASETRFAADAGTTQWIEFTRDGAGHIAQMTLFRNGKILRARAVRRRTD